MSTKEFKNQGEIINETENVAMDNETMQAVIEDNMHFIPKNQLKRFESLSLEEKFKKMQQYQDRAAKIEQWKITGSIIYKVKDLFEKKHATINDAKEVLTFCTEFIDNYKQREIEKIDIEIARLEEMKQSL